ncbi:putative membrane protein YuiB [Sporosarcina sp. NCCP-2222]|uniref:YuiB family protein n=1 Tax=Sporosarcina sp. NCCP-2222 TaxID=2935073 RepID=UPI00208570D7|nr:YuiB family protein [Sporosarcina sp. NCCP-2222]GKV56927.1 putative membrane protein YuiB [Sporosarcina sp. NCCP-2222]
MGQISLVEVILSVLIFVVMFFGIGFLLNMLLRMSWLMAIIYPIVVILIIDEVKFYEYFTKPAYAFNALGHKIMALHAVDIIILTSGLVGAIISGIVIKALRKQGYQMF